jgi:type VI secretion system protein ImpH
LERLNPQCDRFGGSVPHGEPARLKHDPSLSFAAAEISAITCVTGDRPVVTCSFLGLTGSLSPLPEHLIEDWSQQEDEGPLHALFDLWHHRLLALLYRCVSHYSIASELHQDGTDRWSQRLASWSPDHTNLPMWQRLRWLPYWAQSHGGARALLSIVRDLTADWLRGDQVVLDELTGGWQTLCADQTMQLGLRNTLLGDDCVLGEYIDAPASAFCVRLCALDAQSYSALNTPEGLQPLAAVMHHFAPPGTKPTLQLELQPGVHPGWPKAQARLGVDTHLGRPQGPCVIRYEAAIDGTLHAA